MKRFSDWPAPARTLIRAAFAFGAGTIASLSMEPLNFWPLLFVGLSFFYILLSQVNSVRQAVLTGWLFGLGYFLVSLWWIGNALLVDGNEFAWVWPISVIGLPLLLSSFMALAGFVVFRFLNLKSISGFLTFTATLLLVEWLRGNILSGFPWNLFGYAWADVPQVVQVVSVGGIYFLTWLTTIWASLPGFLFVANNASRKTKLILSGAVALSFIACFAFGSWRISSYEETYVENAQIRIVQPNIPQSEKWDRSRMTENFFKHIKLSYPEDDSEATTYIVWPETALSHWYTQDPTSMNLIRQTLGTYRGKAYLITGLLRHDPEKNRYANSVVMIDAEGNISNIYDKSYLVPFGEFIPLQKWIPLKPVANFNGFLPGSGPVALDTPEGLRYAPLVCYEIIFSGIIPNNNEKPADFIVNVTNDAWYGHSAGPYQHFTNAKFRAVEEGIPLIRAANTGISALVDPLGQVKYRAELSEREARTLKIPARITSFYGHIPFQNAILAIIAIFLIAFGRRFGI